MAHATETALSIASPAPTAWRPPQPALAIVWSRVEPHRIGEIFLLPEPGRGALGRSRGEDGAEGCLPSWRQRPGRMEAQGPLTAPRISRVQLELTAAPPDRLRVRNVGRLPLLAAGRPVEEVTVGPGDLLELSQELLLLCVMRPAVLPVPEEDLGAVQGTPFGDADPWGMVGESWALWELRAEVAFVGARQTHVLLRGESGTGKELVAGAIHAASARRDRPLVARNAATIPESLVDAELFGNARNYPNAGMPERPGLIGEADGSTLFLDEIGELPIALQSHLLRVLDQGEYQRLGESRSRRADLRLVAATNRAESELKHDVLARMKMRIVLPGLLQRREDIPLVARHLLRRIAQGDPAIARRFLEGGDPAGEPRLSCALVAALITHPYTTHVRELESLLWRALTASREGILDLPPGMTAFPAAETPAPAPAGPAPVPPQAPPPAEPALAAGTTPEETGRQRTRRLTRALSPADVQEAILRHDGLLERVWPELGLPNRFALYRLIRKHGITVPRVGDATPSVAGDQDAPDDPI